MNVQPIFNPCVTGGNYDRFTIYNESNVTNEAFVENGVHAVPIVDASIRQTFQRSALSFGKVHARNRKW
jgi:hypothetical protein